MLIFLANLVAGVLPVLAFDIRTSATVQERKTEMVTGSSTVVLM